LVSLYSTIKMMHGPINIRAICIYFIQFLVVVKGKINLNTTEKKVTQYSPIYSLHNMRDL